MRRDLGDPEHRCAWFVNPDVVRLVASMSRFYIGHSKPPSAVQRQFANDHVQKFIDRTSFTVHGVDVKILSNPDLAALRILERSRARHILEMMIFKQDTHASIALAKYFAVQNRIEGYPFKFDAVRQRPGNDERDESLKAISYHHILIELLDPTLAEMFDHINEDAVVIYPTISEDGLLLFMIDQSGILPHQQIGVVPSEEPDHNIKELPNLAYTRNLVTTILNNK